MTLHAHADASSTPRLERPQTDNDQSPGWSALVQSPALSGELSLTSSSLSVTSNPGGSILFLSPYSGMYTTVTQPTSKYPIDVVSESNLSSNFFMYRRTVQMIQPVCIGDGLDTASTGLIATVVLPTTIGLVIWLLFAVLRPHYRQIYALREWFVQKDLQPDRLGSNLSAFLFPSVPLVPRTPSNVPDTEKSTSVDARSFPSDEELSQRTLWTCLIIVLGWSVVGLGGILPLYLVSTPCLAHLAGDPQFTGVYSTIQDLSLLRLLQLLEHSSASTNTTYSVRAVLNGEDHARLRILILAILAVTLAVLPALYKILKEISNLVAFRRRWLEVRCEGKEMGWLSARKAPAFAGWGEKRVKDYFVKIGLSSSLGGSSQSNNRQRQSSGRPKSYNSQDFRYEVDVQSLFTICDTHDLALLIGERDEILDNLEVAETRYISSFKISTPDPSIAELEIRAPFISEEMSSIPHISRPRTLGRAKNRPRHRRHNPAQASSSFAPTSFVAPSQYYKLRGLKHIDGRGFAEGVSTPISLTESIKQRIVGTRFLELDKNLASYNGIPSGSCVNAEEENRKIQQSISSIPDPRYYRPNCEGALSSENGGETGTGIEYVIVETSVNARGSLHADWFDLAQETDFGSSLRDGPLVRPAPKPQEQLSPAKPRPRPVSPPPTDRRETFPLRNRTKDNGLAEDVPPPHLRLQPRQPFVRPGSDLNYNDLGAVYSEINQWRSRLKFINMQITEAQQDCYANIADGVRVKGWIMMGRGLRHMHGVELIEGRAKEDVRWDALQNETTTLDYAAFWLVVAVACIFLAAAMTAVAGLALGAAPNVARYLPFFHPLSEHGDLASGLATSLAPAIGATLFTVITLIIIKRAAAWSGVVSVSGVRMLTVKLMFYTLTVVVAAFTVTVGAFLFALEAFSLGEDIAKTVANGYVYMGAFAFVLVINIAVIYPGLMLLQPFRLWCILYSERDAVTPRQRFRAVYPRSYDASYAASTCAIAMSFASAFSLVFPLIGPAVVILLSLTLVAHRYLVGYVWARTLSQTGGLLHIWLLKRLGTLLALQPLLLGAILLSRRLWIEGGVLLGIAIVVAAVVEVYAMHKTRDANIQALRESTQESLKIFFRELKRDGDADADDENHSMMTTRGNRTRGSVASVLEMMSLTLAVLPSASRQYGALPLQTETLDDLTATERAARTHPDAPPHLPPLPFADHAEEVSGILYAPELLAPPPIIWLPNDTAGVANTEAIDLRKYHDIHVTLDVRAMEVKQSTSKRTQA